ncbi:MAG: hypothetical protein WBC45_03790 [Atribacterota bacterium]
MQLNKERIKRKTPKLFEVVPEEKRRETIKEWIDSGRIEVQQRTGTYYILVVNKV